MTPVRRRQTQVRVTLAGLAVLLGASGFILAGNLNPNGGIGIGSTLGIASVTTCSSQPVLTLVPTITGGVERIGEISVDNIPIGCAGKNLVVEFRDQDDTVLDRVVWSLALLNLSDTSISAQANGTTVSTSNSSQSNVSVIYPVSETGSSGLDIPALSSTAIASFTIEATVSAVSE